VEVVLVDDVVLVVLVVIVLEVLDSTLFINEGSTERQKTYLCSRKSLSMKMKMKSSPDWWPTQ
jgi:hypothetical protein